MNATPQSGHGGMSPSQVNTAAPPAPAAPSAAVQLAEKLAAILDNVYGISTDVHPLASGNAIVSVFLGLLAYTDGENFWWTSPELSHSNPPLLSSALRLPVAAAQLAEHHRILRARPATSLLESELPLLADVIPAQHVVPR
ncbi:hypothetical protein [Streptosporangium sp. NPDC049304]|uniref:hypothetical protein n=1 Tax=Streptosporangium sp. NPDC049304 TaxID=3154830 RepID=UPI00342717E4